MKGLLVAEAIAFLLTGILAARTMDDQFGVVLILFCATAAAVVVVVARLVASLAVEEARQEVVRRPTS
jgi:hypothetical protein